MLGEITHDDTTYAGETGGSALEVQYWRNKASEFQAVMESVAVMRIALEEMLPMLYDAPDSSFAEAVSMIEEIDAKKPYIVAAAQAINAASVTANALGVRFPMLSIPQGLGLAPVALAAVAGAVAGVAALTYWGKQILDTWRAWLNKQLLDAAPEEMKAAVITALAKANEARDHADNPFSQAAGMIKWVAIAGLAYLGFRMWQNRDVRGYHGYS
jgi:hypothetical protein